MKAGRELDILVAQKVMGWSPIESTEYCPWYSRDISSAWQVVVKLTSDMVWLSLLNYFGGWSAIFDNREHHGIQCEASTAEVAICLAALAAVGYEVPA